MSKTKLLILGGLFAVLAFLFQAAPAILSEALIPITIFASLPVYIISRIKPGAGAAVFIVAAVLIFTVTFHEGLFFLCTNGPLGFSLGICHHYMKNKFIISAITSVILTLALCIMNYIVGIPVLGIGLPGTIAVQIIILYVFSLVYSFIYLAFASFIFKYIGKTAGTVKW